MGQTQEEKELLVKDMQADYNLHIKTKCKDLTKQLDQLTVVIFIEDQYSKYPQLALDIAVECLKKDNREKEAQILDYEGSKKLKEDYKDHANLNQLGLCTAKELNTKKIIADKAKEHTAMAGITSVNVVNMKLSAGATATTEKGNYRTK